MTTLKHINKNWQNPDPLYRPAPFWSLNSKLEPSRLCRQIESMHKAGMGGFFLHSRYGLKTEYLGDEWFDCMSICIEKAKQLGMKAYLYDEDRWPSGSAGGVLTRSNPEYASHYLQAISPEKLEDHFQLMAVFDVELNADKKLKSFSLTGEIDKDKKQLAFIIKKQTPAPWFNDGAYIDTMNSDAVDAFVESTYDVYADKYKKYFGNLIPAVFTDEPNYGFWSIAGAEDNNQLLWSKNFIEEFKSLRGYDLTPHLPQLVFDDKAEQFSKIRYDYYRTLTELFVENFTKKIGNWCDERNIALTGHLLLEGSLKEQLPAVGNCMPHYEYMQWPGIDLLKDQADELITAKQCSSVADQLGKERVLSELYGCTGWDWPLQGHKFIADWQFAAGINLLCPHLSHYSLAGGAKRDYPASIIDHSPWWKYYKTVNDYLSRTSMMLSQGQPLRDILVIHPIESAWGLFESNIEKQKPIFEEIEQKLKKVIYTLSENHLDWDFADESLLARYAKVDNTDFVVGQMKYKLIIVPTMITLRSTTLNLLKEFLKAGGHILFADSHPTHIDAQPDKSLAEFISQCNACTLETKDFISTIESVLPRVVSITENGTELTCVWSMLRQIQKGNLLFVQSHDRNSSHTVDICVKDVKSPAILWDSLTGQKTILNLTDSKLTLELSPAGSALITFGLDVPDAKEPSASLETIETKTMEGPYDIDLTEPNTLPLDYCRYKFGDEDISELMPTLKADELIRKRFSLEPRLGMEQQPWYLNSKGLADNTPKGNVQMFYDFHLTVLPENCSLVLENPQDYKIFINNHAVTNPDGFWVDEDFHKIDITSLLKIGENQVKLDFDYNTSMELEDLYLLGDFGVSKLNDKKPLAPGNVTLIDMPQKLQIGSWLGQGLDFYSASLRYKFQINRPQQNQHIKINLPDVSCTAIAISSEGKSIVLPWKPFEADITELLTEETNDIFIEVIAGRKNTLGPLHVPNKDWAGPELFSPNHPEQSLEYILNEHGLLAAPILTVSQTT